MGIINHTVQSTMKALISTLTCTSTASNRPSDKEIIRLSTNMSTVAALIVRGTECVLNR